MKQNELLHSQKNNYYIEDATDNAADNTKWTSTTEQEYTVPARTRWFFYGGQVTLDANATLNVYLKDASDNVILHLCSYAATTGVQPMIEAANVGNLCFPIPMNVDEYIHIVAGAAQGAGATASCLVTEVIR